MLSNSPQPHGQLDIPEHQLSPVLWTPAIPRTSQLVASHAPFEAHTLDQKKLGTDFYHKATGSRIPQAG